MTEIAAERAGLWIDHRRAVVVTIRDGVERTTLVRSNVDRQPGRSGGARPAERRNTGHAPADDANDRRFHGELARYYDLVAAVVRDAAAVLIIGPGEAKGELRKRLERAGRADRTISVETADRMTTPRIVARVRAATRAWAGAAGVGA